MDHEKVIGIDGAPAAPATQADKIDWLSRRWAASYSGIETGPWQIWGRLFRIQEHFLAAANKSLQPHGLNYNEFQTLGALVLVGEGRSASPKEIASFTMLSSGGMANLLSRLEAKGLVRRSSNPDDGRGVMVSLTPAGMQRFNAALADENRVEHRMLSMLDHCDRSMLKTLLRKMTAVLDHDRSHPHASGRSEE